MPFNKRTKSSERFANPALIHETDEDISDIRLPTKAQPTHEVPDFILPGFIIFGRMYADATITLRHIGLTGTTTEGLENTLEDLQSRLESMDSEWSARRDRMRKEWLAAEGNLKIDIRKKMLAESIPDEATEDNHTPHQNRFGGVLKHHPYGRGLLPLTIYMTYRQLVVFLEVMEAHYNLEPAWKADLRQLFNDAVPFYSMMDKIVGMLRGVANNALNKSDFTRAFPSQDSGVVEEALKRLVEYGVVQVMKSGGEGQGMRGRPGLIYYLGW